MDKEIRKKAAKPGVNYISPWEKFCKADGCLTNTKMDLMTRDCGDLSSSNAKYTAIKITDQVLR